MMNNSVKGINIVLVILVLLTWMGCAGCGGVRKSINDVQERKDVESPVAIKNMDTSNSKSADQVAHPVSDLPKQDTVPNVQLLGRDENPMRYPSKIRFATGKIIDIRDVDPYRDLPYELLKNVEGGFERLYDLSNLNKTKQDAALHGARINEEAWRDGDYLRIVTKSPVIEVQNGITAIAYHASFYSSTEEILATKGHTLIYDKDGNLLQDIKDEKDGFYDIRLSSDGQYLMQRYGTAYGEDGGGWLEMGFKFYNTRTGEMVFEWELGRDQFLINYGFFGISNFGHFYRSEGDSYQTYIIDFINRTTYYKSMDRVRYANNEPGYQDSLMPSFIKSRKIRDLIEDGFIKSKK